MKKSSREDRKIEDEASLEDRKSVKCKEAEEKGRNMSCRRKLVEKEKQVKTTLDSSIQDRQRR